MNKVWNELLEYESRDLVERYIHNRHKRDINVNRILQITSNFIQGREYFKSAKKASFTVRPLLQYYGIMALTKGLILTLDISLTENQLKSSHGLAVKNWGTVLKTKDFEKLIISVEDGTFSELLKTTRNINYLRANSTEINFMSSLNLPNKGDEFTLKQVIQYFPDLDNEYWSWIEEKLVFAIIQELIPKAEGGKTRIKLEGKLDSPIIDLLFPQEYCPDRTIAILNNSTSIEYLANEWGPNMTQRWHSVLNLGDSCVIPTIPGDIGLNLLSGMYMISYIFGMMARYFPSSWLGLKRVEKGDKIYPFVHRILDFVYDKYPIQIMDFLNSPYEFEKK